jgi:hypothetical protein
MNIRYVFSLGVFGFFAGTLSAQSGGLLNDYCEGAITIQCGSNTPGTTLNALADVVADCGTGIQAPGVWYTFTGVSGAVVLSTCADHGYDTRLNVYAGACDDLQCVTGNDDGPFGCDLGSEVIFTADPASIYLVLVQGYDGATGSFSLAMDCPNCAPPTDLFATPADVQAFVYWTPGNSGATFTVEYGVEGFVLGSGTVITGTIGTDDPPVTITGLTPGTIYQAYVTEDCGGGNVSYTRGPLNFTTLDQPLATNSFCESALPIACGENLLGNTTESIFLPGLACGSAYTEAPGLWYTFTGDGSDVTLSTCGQADYDSKISVYAGTCTDPICVAGNDDGLGCNGNTSFLTFASELGTVYRVIVHGYNGEVGAFTLSMTCAAPCSPVVENDDCANAIVLTPQLAGACVPLTGTNLCAYASSWPNPACDPFSIAADVWYALPTGPSSSHTITVASVTSGDLGVAVYTACDPASFVECYDPQMGAIALTGLQTDATYYMRIWNAGGAEAGSFTICDEADVLASVGERTTAMDIQAWPVPAEDVLNVDGLASGSRLMRLLDGQGREVLAQRVMGRGVQTMSTIALAPGAYVLRVEGEETQMVRVIVK